MHPILFRLGPITIYSFGLLLAISVLVCSFLIWKRARQNALSDEKIIDVFILSLSSLVVGGRLIHVFLNWSFFQNDAGRVFLLLKYPGLSFGGGIAVALVVATLLSGLNGVNPWLLLDIFSFAFSVAAIFGFGGCYLDGCMANFPALTPLILMVVSALITLVLWFIDHRVKSTISLSKLHHKPGFIFLSYLQFITISFLILSYANRKNGFWAFGAVFAVSLIIFLVRYREIIRMVKFPSTVLSQIGDYLEDRRKDIEKKLQELKKEDPFEDKTRLLDRASDDSEAQSKAGHERVTALQKQLNVALIETKKALTKIKIGKYGMCENCGKMIDTDRLAAMPTARLCVSCEKKRER